MNETKERRYSKWKQHGITVAGGNQQGDNLKQLFYPWSICVDNKQTVYVADQFNHRIVAWKTDATQGQILIGQYGQGSMDEQLNYPRKMIIDEKNDSFVICDNGNCRIVSWSRKRQHNGIIGEIIMTNIDGWGLAMDKEGYFYVSDLRKHEIRRWKIGEKKETVVAGGNGQGDRLDQFRGPYHIFVDEEQSIYVSDNGNHRVMKWTKCAKEGIVVAGGHGQGNDLTQLSYPQGIVVDELGSIYIADCHNHRIVRWLKEATEGSVVVGGDIRGELSNHLNFPHDLCFDQENNLYVVDSANHRVQKFSHF